MPNDLPSQPQDEPRARGLFLIGRRTRGHLQLVVITPRKPAAPASGAPATPPTGDAA